jgi:crotonobetainyl-CoA:carnitine CoA-transferase CaiB-like acyl-CoA transferase
MANAAEHLLTGLRVLDFTRALAGPTCTRMLAEMGAEVIKVEAPRVGDMARRFSKIRNERSSFIVQQSLGKKSLCVNLRDPRGMAIVAALCRKSTWWSKISSRARSPRWDLATNACAK